MQQKGLDIEIPEMNERGYFIALDYQHTSLPVVYKKP
jgi:hypothetical protein